jgi:RHS repeat-associated protein
MSYDAIGQMRQQVFYGSDGTPMATNWFGYEPGGKLAAFTNGLGGFAQTLYTQTGKPYFKQNADGSTNGWQYDLADRPVKEFQPNGSWWETTYLDSALKIARQFKNSAGTVLASTTNVFDRRGNTITNIDASGAAFFSTHDGLDRLKISGGPATIANFSTQQVSYFYYDNAGVWVTNQDLLSKRAISQSDAMQRPILTQIYDTSINQLMFSKQTLCSADHHRIDEVLGTSTGSLVVITNTSFVDSFGNVVMKLNYLGPNNRDPNVSPGDIYYSQSAYDAAGRLVSTTDELQRMTTLTYDGRGRVKTKKLGDGATATMFYNSEGGLTSMNMPGSLTWSATYNAANQRTSEKLSNGASVTRQFMQVIPSSGPLAGLPQSAVDLGRSVTNTLTYDAFLRLATNSAVGKLPEQTLLTAYSYDGRGLVTNYFQSSGVNPTTKVARKLDGYGQITNETVTIGSAAQSQFNQIWDTAGRRRQLSQPGAGHGGTIKYSYQVNDLLWDAQQDGQDYEYGYKDNGLLWLRTNPWRAQQVFSQMWNGRPYAQGLSLGGNLWFVETNKYYADSTLYSYTAQRVGLYSGTNLVNGAWDDYPTPRNYLYTYRNQLLYETLGINSTTNASAIYLPDLNQVGVRSLALWWGGWNYGWDATALNPLAQVASEGWEQSAFVYPADGAAAGVSSVEATLDGQTNKVQWGSGRWSADLNLAPGAHTLKATGHYPAGDFSKTATSTFSVNADGAVTNAYDGAGNVTNRAFASGKTQALKWDAAGRLVMVIQRDNPTNGFDWAAIYDGLGRRLRTLQTNLVNNVKQSPQTNDSYFDPQVEFGEIAMAVNGFKVWKVVGPDVDGRFGSMQGVGGLENTITDAGNGTNYPVICDYFGNASATIPYFGGYGYALNWSATRVSGYGPVPGYSPPVLSPTTPLATTVMWQGQREDPTGFYWRGARYYDPVAGRFLSADPAGFEGSTWDLYSFANNDPINQFDPDGRFGKGMAYGIGDVMEGGSYYSSYLNPHSRWSAAGYGAGYVAAEVTEQAAIYFATEGAFSLLARGLGLGAEAMSAEMRFGEEALADETAAVRTGAEAIGAGTEMAELSAARALGGGATESSAGRIATGEIEAGLGTVRSKEVTSIARTLTPDYISRIREFGLSMASEIPGKAGLSPKAPLFFSKPNHGGGRVWLSIYEHNFFDYAPLVVPGQRNGRVLVLSGAHGDILGGLEAYPGIIDIEKSVFRNFNIPVEFMDVMRLDELPESQFRQAINGRGTIICSWCWSGRNQKVLDALRFGH